MQAALITLGAGLVFASLLPTVVSKWWISNVLANFRVQLAIAGGLMALAGLPVRSSSLFVLGTTALVLNAIAIATAWSLVARPPDPDRTGAAEPRLRVMTLNLLFSNRNLDGLARCVAEVQPDLLLVQEAGRFWSGALGAVESLLPHRLTLQHTGTSDRDHGVMLLSRHPIVEARQHSLGGLPDRFGVALIEVAGRAVRAASVHVVKPTGRSRLDRQRQQLQDLAARIDRLDGPLVIGGDFNATLYAPHMQRFVGVTQVDPDDRAHPWRGLLASTFPAALPIFGLKIDHIMVRQLTVRRAWTLSCPGSDHRAVAVDLELPGGTLAALREGGASG